MENFLWLVQIFVALAILNVWILRFGKTTAWRGGDAKNMREEFAVYGLPPWFMGIIGFLKVLLAALLIAGVWIPWLSQPAAIGMAMLMLGAVVMHFKVRDPVQKSLPAFILLLLCLVISLA
jgi:hypothetical protein